MIVIFMMTVYIKSACTVYTCIYMVVQTLRNDNNFGRSSLTILNSCNPSMVLDIGDVLNNWSTL